jgi:hypothetical protein
MNSIAEMLYCAWKDIWKPAISSTDQNCPCSERKLGKALRSNGDCRTCKLKFPLQNDLVCTEITFLNSKMTSKQIKHQWKCMTGFSFPIVYKQLAWVPCKITELGDNLQINCYISEITFLNSKMTRKQVMHQWKCMTEFSFPSVFTQLTWIPCKNTVLGDNIQNNCYISPAWLAINYEMTTALRERKPDCCESRQMLNEPLVSWKNITWL